MSLQQLFFMAGDIIGSSQNNPATSAQAILQVNPNAPDGVYWIRPTGGSGTAFQTYCIMQRYGGGWMKSLQYKDGTTMTGESSINPGGSWINSEINANQAGKITNTDFNAIKGTEFLLRVINGGDNLFNNGQGTAKFTYSTTLPNWGTAVDPTASYSWSLDTTSNNSFDHKANYTNDTRGLCNHATNVWINDHNYNGSFEGTVPPFNSIPICWTFGPTGLYTNLHWMSGQASQSAGSISWGLSGNSTAAAIFIKP
jgi:hypothetical protein